MIVEKESFAGLMALVDNEEEDVAMSSPVNVIDIFNDRTTGDEEARSNLSSYGMELSELLEEGEGVVRRSAQSAGFIFVAICNKQ